MRPRGTGRFRHRLGLLCALDDDLTTAVVAALGADTVIHHSGAAVRADTEGRDRSVIVRSSLVSPLLGEFVFRMCHNYLSLFCLFFVKKSFQSGERAVRIASLLVLRLMTQKPDRVGVALPFRVDPLHGQRQAYIIVDDLAQV